MKEDMIFLWHVFWFTSSYNIIPILANSLQVEIDNGFVEGRQLSTSLYAWSGIPFAKPPVGNWRFELPQPSDNWTGVWDATFERNQCVQTPSGQTQYIGDEDCLYINIYTPKLPSDIDTLLPVMVWIYGGGFIFGESNYSTYGPDQLVSENVIIVTFNYRLGIFGFAFTNDDAIPSNLGLKDQIYALQWVQRNIEAFGGDKTTVTIFGESAGAASVSYLVISSLANGLFHRAIMESGNSLCLWSLSKTAQGATFMTGLELGIFTNNSHYLIEQLRTVAVSDLQNAATIAMQTYLLADPLNGLVFAPVIEPANTVNPITTTSTYERLSSGFFNRVPLLMGFNSFEAFSADTMINLWYIYLLQYDIFPSRLVPESMNVDGIERLVVGGRIKLHYAGILGSIIFPDENFLRYFSDNEFVRPIEKMARLTCGYTPTYFYKFSYRHNPSAPGVGHAEELLYLFNSPYNNPSDIITKNRMVRMWTNFAKTANPTPSADPILDNYVWPKVTPVTFNYMDIDNNITIGQNPNREDINFWKDLFNDFANPPLYTY